jgi:hypothetical protein
MGFLVWTSKNSKPKKMKNPKQKMKKNLQKNPPSFKTFKKFPR